MSVLKPTLSLPWNLHEVNFHGKLVFLGITKPMIECVYMVVF